MKKYQHHQKVRITVRKWSLQKGLLTPDKCFWSMRYRTNLSKACHLQGKEEVQVHTVRVQLCCVQFKRTSRPSTVCSHLPKVLQVNKLCHTETHDLTMMAGDSIRSHSVNKKESQARLLSHQNSPLSHHDAQLCGAPSSSPVSVARRSSSSGISGCVSSIWGAKMQRVLTVRQRNSTQQTQSLLYLGAC